MASELSELPQRPKPGTSRSSSMGEPLSQSAVLLALNGQTAGNKPKIRLNADGTYTISSVSESTLFGPGQPLYPMAQGAQYGARGRRWDYPTLRNTNYTPRGETSISFNDLRALSRNYDLLRTVIETRKDQMEALDWKVAYRDTAKDEDQDVRDTQLMFTRPDKRLFYGQWMRACLEEVFVTDALTIYPVFTNAGDFYAFEQIDGTKIFPLIDEQGRSPDPPNPAYQQIIKGSPAVDYTRDELLYLPRNVSVHSVYGYSPVEQIIVSVNIALRRQIFQLDYYRMGSIPDAIINTPDGWSPEQVAAAQDYWDSQFDNPGFANASARRKMKFIPGTSKVTFAKDAVLKDEYDEWLARIVCYAFSVEPTPFIKAVNRASAENQKEQSREEGLVPLKKYYKSIMDYLLILAGKQDMEFVWDDADAVDPLIQSQINVAEVNAGIVTADEVRAERGLAALPEPIETDPRMATTEQLAPTAPGADPNAQTSNGPTGTKAPTGKGGATGQAPPKGATGATGAKPDGAAGGNVIHLHVGKVSRGTLSLLRKGMVVNDQYDVPYGFGISKDGQTLYRDKDIPQILDVDGTPIDLDETCTVHELTEFSHCKDGDPYLQGHQKADEAEHPLVAAQGVDPARYEAVLADPHLKQAYAKGQTGNANTPPDIATYPYHDSGEMNLLGGTERLAKARAKGTAYKESRDTAIQRQRLTRSMKRNLRSQSSMVKEAITPHLKAEGGTPDKTSAELMSTIDFAKLQAGVPEAVNSALKLTHSAASKIATKQVQKSVYKDAQISVGINDTLNQDALDYATERGAEMVGMKWVDGELVPNPDAEWQITDETRTGIQSLLEQSIEQGWSQDAFSDALSDAYAFSSDRADMIARTETRLAESKGSLSGWKDSGVVEKKVWLISNDGCCDDCQDNADEGPIDIDDDFPSGDDSAPAHPNCKCTIAPIVSSDDNNDSDED